MHFFIICTNTTDFIRFLSLCFPSQPEIFKIKKPLTFSHINECQQFFDIYVVPSFIPFNLPEIS